MRDSRQTAMVRSLMVAGMCVAAPAFGAEVDVPLHGSMAPGDTASVLLVLPDQKTPMLSPLRVDADVVERRRLLVATLQARADVDQAALRDWLERRGIAYRSYWIANLIEAELNHEQIAELARRDDLAKIVSNLPVRQRLPQALATSVQPKGVHPNAWGVDMVNAPAAWALGHEGQGVVVGGADTGYQWDHPALKAQYRGWNGSHADHDYNWHDAVHHTGSSCGADAPAPCDDHNHGTHTMGSMVGVAANGDVIGVAPQARWVGCRNMNAGDGTPARYIECMEWFLAPTDSNGNNPDPSMAPDVINNSWGCIPDEGCTTGEELRTAVGNVVAGGILFVVAAGNDGRQCSTIFSAPATYSDSFVVAATDSQDRLADFSSRGPIPGMSEVGLDISAPGVHVYSSVRNNYAYMSGTSMAAPHAAGVAALVMSANPQLRGQPHAVAEILRESAARNGIADTYNTGCGGLTMADWPNWQAGHGRVDALAAVKLAVRRIFSNGFEAGRATQPNRLPIQDFRK